jgi:hypothetical protein
LFEDDTNGTVHLICPGAVGLEPQPLEDVSAGGVRLLTARPLPVGGLAVLDLPGLALTVARVVYAIEQEDGLWAAGCALLAPLADDDVRALGA